MKLSKPSNLPFWARLCTADIGDELGHHGVEIEAMVETVAKASQVLSGVFAELECLVRSGDRSLEIAQYSVEPFELRQISWLLMANDDVGVSATGLDHTGKAAEPIAQHIVSRNEVDARPQSATALLVNPCTGDIFTRIGRPSSLTETAAMKSRMSASDE